VKLEISFQYSLISEGLFNLYKSYAQEYSYIIQNVAIDALSDLTTNYTAYNFFMDRGRIGMEMQSVSPKAGSRLHSERESFCYMRILPVAVCGLAGCL